MRVGAWAGQAVRSAAWRRGAVLGATVVAVGLAATALVPAQGSGAPAADLGAGPVLLADGGAAPAAVTPADPLARVHAIADRSGFDWRGAGGEFVVGCAPSTVQARCTLGAYVTSERRMYVAPGAFATDDLLTYVVLHEQAHLWQFTAAPPRLRAGVMAPFGLTGLPALEAGADCLALHWGATFPGAYGCPDGAAPVVGELFAATVG